MPRADAESRADPTSRTAALRDVACQEYAASKGTFWLTAFPDGLQLDRCELNDPNCGTVVNGRIALPWAGIHNLGGVNTGQHGAFQMFAFSLYSSFQEVERFLSFASEAGAALVTDPPAWAPSLRRAGSPAASWVALLIFLPSTIGHEVVERPGGCRLITQPWAASVAVLRDWQKGIDSKPPTGNKKGEGGKPPAARGGRLSLAASKKPEDKAKLNIYEVIRAMKDKNPSWGRKTLYTHFKSNKDFRKRVDEANLDYAVEMFHAAIEWIKANPVVSQESQSGNVS